MQQIWICETSSPLMSNILLTSSEARPGLEIKLVAVAGRDEITLQQLYIRIEDSDRVTRGDISTHGPTV